MWTWNSDQDPNKTYLSNKTKQVALYDSFYSTLTERIDANYYEPSDDPLISFRVSESILSDLIASYN